VDGTDYRRLTNNQPDDTLAEWSPDSRYIAVNSGRSGGDEIMVVDVENNASTLITHNRDTGMALSHPVWSPDSTRLALVSESNLYLVNRDGSDLHLVGNAGFDYISGAALWSPDGERILLVGSVDRARRLGVAELTTGTMQEIAAGASSVGSPMWLPDGQQIALETGAEGGCDHGIVLVNVVRGDLRIVGEGRPASQVCFLLDVLNANTLLVQKKDALYTLDVSSGTATRFGDPPPSGSLVSADWQYATEVLGEYNAPKGLSDQIWLTDLTTGERRRIFAGDHRSPRDLAFSPDGAALAMGMDKLSDGIDIMLLDLSGEGEPRNLTARSLIARWIASRGGEILD
jgi:Tol biopolymer transport system component